VGAVSLITFADVPAKTRAPVSFTQKHVCFLVFWGEQEICKPPWGSVTARFFQKGRQNHLFAGIDASPLVLLTSKKWRLQSGCNHSTAYVDQWKG